MHLSIIYIKRKLKKKIIFFIDNSNTLTIRYEDLVRKPQDVLRLVCKHINEDFEEAMLTTAASAQSVAPPNEPWKSQVGQPLDSSRTYVWKRQLPQELWFATSHICQLGIEEFDYELTSKPKQTFLAYDVNRAFVEKNENFIISLANNQIYIAPARNKQSTTNDELMNPNLVICKLPDMGATNTQRLINTYRFVMMLIRRRINGNINKYLECCTDSDVVRGIAQKACISSLRLLGTKTEFSLEELSN